MSTYINTDANIKGCCKVIIPPLQVGKKKVDQSWLKFLLVFSDFVYLYNIVLSFGNIWPLKLSLENKNCFNLSSFFNQCLYKHIEKVTCSVQINKLLYKSYVRHLFI